MPNVNTMNKVLIGLAVLAVLLAGIWMLFGQPEDVDQEEPETRSHEESTTKSEEGSTEKVIITYTDNGYVPSDITVTKGETVTFTNESSRGTWPATNIHPTHTLYPGSNRSDCESAEPGVMFDSCKVLDVNEEWSFQFNEVGEWSYHDHIRPGDTGRVIVE